MSPRRLVADMLLGSLLSVATLSIVALAWYAFDAGLPLTSGWLVTALIAAGVVVWRSA